MQQLIWRSRCRRCRWRGRARRPPSAFGCRGGAVLVVGSAPLRARRAPPGFAASARRTRVLLYEALRNPTRGSSSLCSLGAPSRVVLTASDEVCRSFGAQVSVAQSCCLGGRRPSCCQGRRKSFQGPGAAGAARPRPRLASAEQERASQERVWFLAQITAMYVGLIIGGSCTQTCSLNTLSGTGGHTGTLKDAHARTHTHTHLNTCTHADV